MNSTTTTLLTQLGLVVLYFGTGYLLRHLQGGSSSTGVLQQVFDEVEDQVGDMIKGHVAAVVKNAINTPKEKP